MNNWIEVSEPNLASNFRALQQAAGRLRRLAEEKKVEPTIPITMTRPQLVKALRGEIAAVVVERTDGTCTVLWAGLWRTFNSKPEEWETRREAMTAVDTVVGEILIWNEMAPHTWAARAA